MADKVLRHLSHLPNDLCHNEGPLPREGPLASHQRKYCQFLINLFFAPAIATPREDQERTY